MCKIFVLGFFLTACAAPLTGGKLLGSLQPEEPYLEEVPKLPLGAVTAKKYIRVSNPLDLPVVVVLECNKTNMPEVKVLPHRWVEFEMSVDVEQAYSQTCSVATWNTLQGF